MIIHIRKGTDHATVEKLAAENKAQLFYENEQAILVTASSVKELPSGLKDHEDGFGQWPTTCNWHPKNTDPKNVQ